jgi:iron(III) transport system ATP-binding protein
MAELRCEGVSKSFGGSAVLRDLGLVVAEGSLTAILGASGSGKTTLLRIVMGLVRADAGTIAVGGEVVADARRVDVAPDKRAVGYVAQEGALFPHLSVAENVGFGLPRGERKRGRRVAEVLELAGLGEVYGRRRPQELSGGEQRRVALARALAPRPRLVLLDEPFSGLDAALRAETREAVVGALTQEGATAVLVTHDQGEALSIGSEVGVLRAGRLVQRAPPGVLYREPVDLDVARFVGEAVVLRGDASRVRTRARVVCPLGELELRSPGAEGAVEVMIRPEQIAIVRSSSGEADGEGADPEPTTRGARARVLGHTYYGPHTIVRLALDGAPATDVRARTLDQRPPATGELVELTVNGPVVAFPAGRAENGRAELAVPRVGATRAESG